MLLYIYIMSWEEPLKNQTADKRTERISGVSIPAEWGERALTVFSLLVIVYAFFEVRYEIAKGKDLMATLNAVFANVAIFMTFTFGALVILIHGWDWIMFRHKMVQEAERRAETAIEQAEAAERQAEAAERQAEAAESQARAAERQAEAAESQARAAERRAEAAESEITALKARVAALEAEK